MLSKAKESDSIGPILNLVFDDADKAVSVAKVRQSHELVSPLCVVASDDDGDLENMLDAFRTNDPENIAELSEISKQAQQQLARNIETLNAQSRMGVARTLCKRKGNANRRGKRTPKSKRKGKAKS